MKQKCTKVFQPLSGEGEHEYFTVKEREKTFVLAAKEQDRGIYRSRSPQARVPLVAGILPADNRLQGVSRQVHTPVSIG